MADLINATSAKLRINQASFSSDEDDLIDALVTAVSKAVKTYCGREFDSQTFDEVYENTDSGRLVLRQYPIISIARVATSPTTVLQITNTSASHQRATVAVTSSGLTLVRVASGVTTTTTSVSFAGNVTISAVKTAVDALANGWSAVIPDSNYSLWPSADLRAVQGALNAYRVYAGLQIHTQELSAYSVDHARGWLTHAGCTGFGESMRVIYTAGYATVPEDVQEACCQWVAALYFQGKRDPGLAQESVTGAVYRSSELVRSGVPRPVQLLLLPYRKRAI